MSDPNTTISHTSRLGGWLPVAPNQLNQWLKTTIEQAEKTRAGFRPVIKEFQDMIESDPVLRMYFTQMFRQQPRFRPPPESGDVKIKDYQQMLTVINHVLATAPTFNTTGMVGFPINAILDFAMCTPAGLAAFAMPKVNSMFCKILKAWAQFLDSPDSCYVLNASRTGWLCSEAQELLHLDDFQTDPNKPYLGFKSWNDFFIREFKPGRRPVACPTDDSVIVSACESGPYAIQTQVQEHDAFWLKAQPYSLSEMLNGQFVKDFIGGTVYQAFLSADKYHRWHSPVAGTIKKLDMVPGTYYAEAASEGFDPAGPNNSQGYIAHVATRAMIFIEADNPSIGLVCMVAIGMAEVSSCVLKGADGKSLQEEQRVMKGDQLGYFQFGGSTHCLVFRPGAISEFALQAIPQGQNGSRSTTVEVNSYLARAAKAK
jgi:phosphatidylserine decarboxylase